MAMRRSGTVGTYQLRCRGVGVSAVEGSYGVSKAALDRQTPHLRTARSSKVRACACRPWIRGDGHAHTPRRYRKPTATLARPETIAERIVGMIERPAAAPERRAASGTRLAAATSERRCRHEQPARRVIGEVMPTAGRRRAKPDSMPTYK